MIVFYAYAINETKFIGVFSDMEKVKEAYQKVEEAEPGFWMHFLAFIQEVELDKQVYGA